FKQIIRMKEACGIQALQVNPSDLLERAKAYATRFKNGSYGWSSNIWHRSANNTVVIEREEDLKPEHKFLMLRVLEHILARPMIAVDAIIGPPGSVAEMRCRLYCDPQFPDIAYRWQQLNFPAYPNQEPEVELFHIPHYLNNPNIPGTDRMLMVMRFPNHNYTIITVSSYQGETKKGFLAHWILHVYKKGGTGEHASLKEFTVKRVDGKLKRIVMCVWGLTGSGKSTHGLYVVDERIARRFIDLFGVNPLEFISDQVIKNDDIVAVFRDRVYCSEKGSWTKTEDVDENQVVIYKAATSPKALHENTEWDDEGNVSFAGEVLQYCGRPNQNARSVLMLEDTGYYDGVPYSSEPLNMAVFISPGYITDYAWLKINDPAFAAKVLADGRTVGHPAQSIEGVGEEKFSSRYCLPFTMGVSNAAHVNRFYEFMKEREGTDNPIEVYQLNTTGRVGTEYRWVEIELDGKRIEVPRAIFRMQKGKMRPVGGTGPTIEETELFLFQAARGAVKYEPHPIWGEKVLVPVEVPGIPKERLKELNPFTYRSREEMEKALRAQIELSKYYLSKQCPGLLPEIEKAMDF
ncbi:phosphoenolpyruvate carboxykinase, partial [Candidatus Poribacteria bacterium]